MTKSSTSFSVTEPGRVEVKIHAGDVRLLPGAGGTIEVVLSGAERSLARVTVDQIGPDTVRIESEKKFGLLGSVDVVVVMAAGASADVVVGSGDVGVEVPLTELRVGAASGDVRVGRVTDRARIKTASGDVVVDEVGGHLTVGVASGDVRVGSVGGDARVKSASGDIELDRVGGRVEGSTAAGDLSIHAFAGDDLRCNALSGDITVGIPQGRTLEVDLRTMTGNVVNDLGPPAAERTGRASLQIKTMAGNIRLKPSA